MSKLRRLCAAIAVAIVAAAGFTSPAHATYPARNGQITFSADTGSGYQLYTVDPNGNNLHRITQLKGDAVNADWSPDGRQLVFGFSPADGSSCSDIELINPDGTGLTNLTTDPSVCEDQPSFTPDGSTIVFERYDPATNVDAIWRMDLTGGSRQEITTGTGSGVTDPNVSPDGTTLSFVDFNGADFGQALYTSTLDGNNLRQLTPFTFDVAIKQDWSPDGKRLLFTNNADITSNPANIATIRPDGTGLQYLTHLQSPDLRAYVGSYSPDGHWIVFRLEDQGSYGLYRMSADGGPIHAIIPLSSFKPRFIDWGPAQKP
jgi:Tol biopolymer transport system component